MLLLALARTGSFEIEVEGWLGKAGEEAATGNGQAPAAKVFCIYGAEEKDGGCTIPGRRREARTAGRPPLDEDYPLAKKMLQAIRDRENAPDA